MSSFADPRLHTRNRNGRKLILVLYVDGLIASSNKEDVEQFMTDLKKSFQISSSEAKFYLGLEIAQEKDGIKITQKDYIDNILRKFYMKKANPEGTPIVKCSQNIEPGKAEGKFPYSVAVGALMYIMVGTRPDIIAYAVGVATRSLENLTEDDIMKVKMIFRYLRGTVSHGIKYQVNSVKALEAYSDADHAGDLASRRSTTGVICRLAEGAISWFSQRQASVSISTTKAEIVASSDAAKELVWLKRLFSELTQIDKPRLFLLIMKQP